jgi:hypothetical protein
MAVEHVTMRSARKHVGVAARCAPDEQETEERVDEDEKGEEWSFS